MKPWAPPAAELIRCAHCSGPLKPDELEFYSDSCEPCVDELHEQLQRDIAVERQEPGAGPLASA